MRSLRDSPRQDHGRAAGATDPIGTLQVRHRQGVGGRSDVRHQGHEASPECRIFPCASTRLKSVSRPALPPHLQTCRLAFPRHGPEPRSRATGHWGHSLESSDRVTLEDPLRLPPPNVQPVTSAHLSAPRPDLTRVPCEQECAQNTPAAGTSVPTAWHRR